MTRRFRVAWKKKAREGRWDEEREGAALNFGCRQNNATILTLELKS